MINKKKNSYDRIQTEKKSVHFLWVNQVRTREGRNKINTQLYVYYCEVAYSMVDTISEGQGRRIYWNIKYFTIIRLNLKINKSVFDILLCTRLLQQVLLVFKVNFWVRYCICVLIFICMIHGRFIDCSNILRFG